MRLLPIVTLGPATSSEAGIAALLDVAAAFRLNASHLSSDALADWLATVDRVFTAQGRSIPVSIDLQGAKMRIGEIPPRHHMPDRVRLVHADAHAAPDHIPVPHAAFFTSVAPGDLITLNDARIALRVTSVSRDHCDAEVTRNGPLSSHKGLNRDTHPLPCPRLSDADRAAVETALRWPFTRFAFSFVHDGAEAALLRPLTGDRVVAAKIELPLAFPHLPAIAAAFDELWLCRGDLGAQAGLAALGPLQEAFVEAARRFGKPYYLAGQVLEHMTWFPQPTRAEVVGLHQAWRDGFAGIVLSDETAVGRHPREVGAFLSSMS